MDPCGRGRAEEEEFSPDELEAAEGLLEFSGRMREMWQLPVWGFKQKRSRMTASCRGDFNYDDEVEEREHEQEQEQGIHATALKMIRPAAGEDKGRKKSRVTEAGKKEGSPTTPLSWSGNERGTGSTSGGGAGDRSDTASQADLLISAAPPAPPCDRQLGHRPEVKVEIGDKVHNPSSRRGPKKKTNAELKERVKELSSENQELEKEKKRRLQLLQSLRDQNESLKEQVAQCVKKEETKHPAMPPEISCDLAQKTEGPALLKSSFEHVELECSENLDVNSLLPQVIDGTSSFAKIFPPHDVNMNNSGTQDLIMTTESPSECFLLPDLNIPLDLEDPDLNIPLDLEDPDLNIPLDLEDPDLNIPLDLEDPDLNIPLDLEDPDLNIPLELEDPDLNIPLDLEDPSDNSFELDKAVVAAEARKHRKECLRGKHSQSVKARFR